MENLSDIDTRVFCVVEFIKDKLVAVVPTTWMSLNFDKCFWPTKKDSNLVKLQSNPRSKPDETWSEHDIKVIKFYGVCNL